MRSSVISWLAMACASCLLAACGSSAPAFHSASASTRTRAQSAALASYIALGDRVCREGIEAIAPIDARGRAIERGRDGRGHEAQMMVPVLRAGLREYRRYDRRLARIPPPRGDAETVEAILSGLRRVGDDLERLTTALEHREAAAVRTITAEREMDHARVSALELEFGFKVCGRPTPHSSFSG